MNIGGIDVELRSLTVREVRAVHETVDIADREIAALALASAVDVNVVRAWYDTAPAGLVFAAVNAMWTVTNATEDARFQTGSGDDVGVERETV